MSYARWGADSAVYVFADSHGGVMCCGCLLTGSVDDWGQSLSFYDADSLIAHLREHEANHQIVPPHLFDPTTYDPEDFDDHRQEDDS